MQYMPNGCAVARRILQSPRLAFLLPGVGRVRYLLLEGLRHRVLLTGVAVQTHEREEVVRLSVFGFAIGKAGRPPEALPASRCTHWSKGNISTSGRKAGAGSFGRWTFRVPRKAAAGHECRAL